MFFVENIQHSFGLDISDLAIRLAVLKKKKQGFKIEAYGEKLLPPGLISEGAILKPDQVAAMINDLIKKAVGGRIKMENVIACLPEIKTFIKLISIPWPKDNNLTESIITETQKHIPLSLSESYLDWQIVASQEKEWLKILLGVAPQKIVNNYIELLKFIGLMPTVLEVEAAAISRSLFLGGEAAMEKCFIILDLGATRSSIIIYAENTIQFSLTIPLSGVQITQNFAAAANLSYQKAEEMKIKYGLEQPTGDSALTAKTSMAAETNQILLQTLNPLLEKIKEAIEFYKLNYPKTPAPEQILLTGGGAHLIGLGRLIKNALGLPAEIANPFINIKGGIPKEHSSSYATAIGLAMRGCQPEKFYDIS